MNTLYDVTALVVRRRIPVMTGIDRVDFHTAWQLAETATDVSECGHSCAFLFRSPWISRVLPAAAMKTLLQEMRLVRGLTGVNTGTLAEVLAVLSRPPEPVSHRGSLKIGRYQAMGIGKRDYLDAFSLVVRHGQSLNAYLRGVAGNLRYVHCSHHGFRQPRRFSWLPREGVETTFFLHDLIPVRYPQFCSEGARLSLLEGISCASALAQRIAVNSAATADDLLSYLIAAKLRVPQIEVHRLGVSVDDTGAGISEYHSSPLFPYFVCPGTMDGRKNVEVLLQAWRLLAKRRSIADMPRLILAGARGWNSEGLNSQLDTMTDIAPFIVEARGLNDTELATLTGKAKGVLQPSLAEGFSLAAADAFARGLPVLVSDIAAHKELGIPAAHRIPVQSAEDWANAIDAGVPALRGQGRSWASFAEKLVA